MYLLVALLFLSLPVLGLGQTIVPFALYAYAPEGASSCQVLACATKGNACAPSKLATQGGSVATDGDEWFADSFLCEDDTCANGALHVGLRMQDAHRAACFRLRCVRPDGSAFPESDLICRRR